MNNIATNWKTTVMGLVVSILTVVSNMPQQGVKLNWKSWLLAAAIAAWGGVMKDFNVTGGTIPATSEAVERTTPEATAPPAKAKS